MIWLWNVSDFFFLASVYDGQWPVLSLTVASYHRHRIVSVFIIPELGRGRRCSWDLHTCLRPDGDLNTWLLDRQSRRWPLDHRAFPFNHFFIKITFDTIIRWVTMMIVPDKVQWSRFPFQRGFSHPFPHASHYTIDCLELLLICFVFIYPQIRQESHAPAKSTAKACCLIYSNLCMCLIYLNLYRLLICCDTPYVAQ